MKPVQFASLPEMGSHGAGVPDNSQWQWTFSSSVGLLF